MSDSSRPTSPASSSAPPQRHVSGSLKDRIAKFENLGAGSSNAAPIPRPFDRGSQGSYARGGLVGNRLPSLDPKTAGLPNAGPRRVSERRDLIGNRVPSLGNANVAAALAPRHTGGSVGSASAASSPTSTAATSTAPTSTGTPTTATTSAAATPEAAPASSATPSAAAASTAGLGLGRPGAPAPAPAAKAEDVEPPQSERSSSPAGSTKSTGPVSTAGSASVSATSSALSAPDSTHSGSAPTSATSSPATSPGGALPPQLLVSSLPEHEDSGTMTPLSTRAEAGEEAPSELSMPATPVANNPDLPPPGYDLVPGNLALAAGPQAMASSPSISSSLVSQYDPKSEDAESVNLKDVSNVSTPTGTPRQAHKTLDDDGSIAGSAAGSTRGDRSGPEDVDEKMSGLAVSEKKAEEDKASTEGAAQAEAKVADFPPMSESASAATLSTSDTTETKADADTPSASAVRDTATGSSTLSPTRDDTATTPTPDTTKPLVDEKAEPAADEKAASPVAEAVGAAVAAPVALAAAAAVPVVAATTALAKDAAEPASPIAQDKAAAKDDAAEEITDKAEAKPEASTTEEQDQEPAGSDMQQGSADFASTTTASDAKSLASEDTAAVSDNTSVKETPAVAEVEELAEIGEPEDETDPPKPDNSSEVTTIAPIIDRQEEDDDLKAPSPTSASMLPPGTGPRDRDITPLASQLNSLAIDEPGLERESTPVPEHSDASQPPPALDDDSDIVSVLGATGSERGDDLHSNRSSMPPARASSELEFRYEDLHERFFRESQSKADGSPVTEDTPTPSTFLAQGRNERDGQDAASGSEAQSQVPQTNASSSTDAGVSPAATAAFASGSAAVAGSALAVASHSFRENSDSTTAPVMGESGAAGGVVNGSGFPSVPSTELESRRPVQIHIEPSPHGIIAPHPAVNVEAPSPLGRTFDNTSESKVSLSDASSAETSRVPTPAPPSFPSAPGNDISVPQTPSRASTPSYAATPGGITPGLLHSFPPVPDEEHPYVEVHVSHDANHRVPFPRSVSDRSGLGLARTTNQSPLISAPKRTSSLRAPLSPRTHPAHFAPSTPPLGSSPSPNLSIESCSDHPPGSRARSPGRKRHSFTPRSPLLDDEDPGDFEPGEAWAIVNRWEPWRAPSQGGM